MTLNVYRPADVTVVIGGLMTLSGYVDGTFLEVTKDINPYRSKRTPDGTTARIYVNDRNYTIRFTLAQSSGANNLLTKIQQGDELTQRGLFPLLIKDNSGSSLLFSPSAWIEGIPSQTFSNDIESRTWELKATGCANIIGGNDSETGALEDILSSILASSPTLVNVLGDQL